MKKSPLIPLVLFPYVLFAQAESVLNPSYHAFSRALYWECATQGYAALKEAVAADACIALPFSGSEAVCARISGLLLAGFRQTEASVSFAKSFAQRLSFALGASYVSLSFSDAFYGRKQGMDISIASCYRARETSCIGVLWKNPFGFSYFVEGVTRERIPSELRFSGMYRCADKVLAYAEYVQDFSSGARLSLGVDVCPRDKLRLFTALRFPDVQLRFGAGCEGRCCQYAVCCGYSRPLGTTVGLSVGKSGLFTAEGLGL